MQTECVISPYVVNGVIKVSCPRSTIAGEQQYIRKLKSGDKQLQDIDRVE